MFFNNVVIKTLIAKRTNVSVRHEIGATETLFSAVVKQRLQYFGLVSTRDGDNLEKVICLEKWRGKGTEEGKGSDSNKDVCIQQLFACSDPSQLEIFHQEGHKYLAMSRAMMTTKN